MTVLPKEFLEKWTSKWGNYIDENKLVFLFENEILNISLKELNIVHLDILMTENSKNDGLNITVYGTYTKYAISLKNKDTKNPRGSWEIYLHNKNGFESQVEKPSNKSVLGKIMIDFPWDNIKDEINLLN